MNEREISTGYFISNVTLEPQRRTILLCRRFNDSHGVNSGAGSARDLNSGKISAPARFIFCQIICMVNVFLNMCGIWVNSIWQTSTRRFVSISKNKKLIITLVNFLPCSYWPKYPAAGAAVAGPRSGSHRHELACSVDSAAVYHSTTCSLRVCPTQCRRAMVGRAQTMWAVPVWQWDGSTVHLRAYCLLMCGVLPVAYPLCGRPKNSTAKVGDSLHWCISSFFLSLYWLQKNNNKMKIHEWISSFSALNSAHSIHCTGKWQNSVTTLHRAMLQWHSWV